MKLLRPEQLTAEPTIHKRFWSKVEKTEHCWNWVGRRLPSGYGQIWSRVEKRPVNAHRVSMIIGGNNLNEGMCIDHICKNKSCVNPEHLREVSNRFNVLRGESYAAKRARATHCMSGHEFNNINTYIYPDGRRKCRVCRREQMRRYNAHN